MKEKRPIHTKGYNITLFFSNSIIEAIFLIKYTDIFGGYYENVFIDNNGTIYLISQVEKWV